MCGWESAAAAFRISGETRWQDLDGDEAPEARVARLVHLAHSAFAQLLEDPIGAQRGANHGRALG
jgi:hypothetical protein